MDFSHGTRSLSRLRYSARKYAETVELVRSRRSTGESKDSREGMNASAKHLLNSLERAMGMKATKKVSVQEVHVFENEVVDTEAEGLNVELKSVGWRFFEEKAT